METMPPAGPRVLTLSFGIFCVFASAVLILLRAMPGPYKPLDYVVIGAIATFASMLTLFVVLITTWAKPGGVIFRKRMRMSPNARR
jgi:hypothetical protein